MRLILACGIICVFCSATFASEEDILPPRKVFISTDAGQPFGEVSAAVEATGEGNEYRIKAIALTVDGKKFEVPEKQFLDLRNPLLNTLEFRREAGRTGQPLLYVCFLTAKPGAKSIAEYPRIYIRFQNGKLLERQIQHPQG